MRLLHTSRLSVEEFTERKSYGTLVASKTDAVEEYAVPRYAILSHTWGDEEVLFTDIRDAKSLALARYKAGYEKIQGSCQLARKEGYDWIWIDTCCINKRSSAELSEAINSMFRWYRKAAVCYVYLSDAKGTQPMYMQDDVVAGDLIWNNRVPPRWYSRGWKL
jgi:hypothetical protein